LLFVLAVKIGGWSWTRCTQSQRKRHKENLVTSTLWKMSAKRCSCLGYHAVTLQSTTASTTTALPTICCY